MHNYIAPEDYTAVSVNFDIAVNMTDDVCVNITIEQDQIFEDSELFLVDVFSDTVEQCPSSFAFVHILDSDSKNIIITTGPSTVVDFI